MTDEISEKVEHIKSSASDTIVTVGQIIKQIAAVDEQTTTVAASIEEQNVTASEISRNIHGAAHKTDSVSKDIGDIQQASNDSASATQQFEVEVDKLAQQADNFRRL